MLVHTEYQYIVQMSSNYFRMYSVIAYKLYYLSVKKKIIISCPFSLKVFFPYFSVARKFSFHPRPSYKSKPKFAKNHYDEKGFPALYYKATAKIIIMHP